MEIAEEAAVGSRRTTRTSLDLPFRLEEMILVAAKRAGQTKAAWIRSAIQGALDHIAFIEAKAGLAAPAAEAKALASWAIKMRRK